jgi:hypothetical protein
LPEFREILPLQPLPANAAAMSKPFREVACGRFAIDAFETSRNWERERVCYFKGAAIPRPGHSYQTNPLGGE